MTPNTFNEVLTLIVAYLLGSIPWGLLVSGLFKLPDPRVAGSQNIGATNILRLGHKEAALLTLILDILKGSFAVIFAWIFAPSLIQLAAICAVLGHIWPIWIGLRGGKGIATAFGAFLILSWPLALACLVSWLIIAITTRYSSLASLITVLLSPLYTAVLTGEDLVITCLILALILVWSHRQNIGRLVTGREPKIGEHSSKNTPEDR
jgi:acyl phosphate:glycerol-3-phosphate acyltransferase